MSLPVPFQAATVARQARIGFCPCRSESEIGEKTLKQKHFKFDL